MKVVSKILAIMILVLSFSFCYAEEELVVDDSAQENLGVVDTESLGIEGFDEDEELKQYYQDYRDYLEEYYNTYERTPSIKARVLSAEEPKEKYQIDYTSYSIAKYVAQPLTVEILEGEYEGQTLEMDFILTGDSLNNIIVSKLEKGDTVFIDVIPNEDGTLTGSVSNAWASTERVSILLIIGIILALLLIIYGGKRGFTTALVVSIIIVFATIIFV